VIIKGRQLVKQQQTWQIETASDKLIEIGHYGLAPTARLVQIGPDNYGVLFDEHATHEGEFSRILFLIGITIVPKPPVQIPMQQPQSRVLVNHQHISFFDAVDNPPIVF
jgi:hypothetical protein